MQHHDPSQDVYAQQQQQQQQLQAQPNFIIDVNKGLKTELLPVKRKDLVSSQHVPKCFNGLSRPAFDATGHQFMFGTEFMENESVLMNRIVLGRIEPDDLTSDTQQDDQWQSLHLTSYPINEHVRDIDWLDPLRVVVALNQKLGIVVLGENQTLNEIVLFPDFHTDTIRELAVNPKIPHLVISGGFDGNVFVTDISRLVDDIQKSEKKSENSVYLCKDVVGSVSWHPNDHNVASCTTDPGVLHVFDIRTEQQKPAFVYDTGKSELYCHAYVDDFTICLGYGDGVIQIHDIRFGKGMLFFKDPCIGAIGDMQFAETTSLSKTKKMAVFGVPEMTMWRFSSNPSAVECVCHHTFANIAQRNDFKTAGAFVPNTSFMLATDSAGYVSLYDHGAF